MVDGSEPDGPEVDGSGVDGSGVDGSEPDPDRPASARPFRVVGFDDLGDTAGERTVRVAAFGDLDTSASERSRVAPLDGRRTRRSGTSGDRATGRGPDRADGSGGRRGADRPVSSAVGASVAEPSGPDPSGSGPSGPGPSGPGLSGSSPSGPDPSAPGVDDGVPPDGPLPRGRRRGGRVGRLGPDAPDPDRPQPAADPVAAAREICLRLLTDRARTRQELAQALARKGVPAEAAATVLDRFDEVGLIDDVAFAEQWVRSRHAHRGLGRRAIAVELRRKGVADDVAGEALAEVDAESEARRARELVDRKLRSLAVDTAEQRAKAANRLVGMLARKGYGAGVAYGVVREALADHGADTDELTADPPG